MAGPTRPPSTRTTLERALDEALGRLSRAEPSPDTRALLIEARRLKALMSSWAAVPPPPEARREMLARVMRIAADAGSSSTSMRPPTISIEPIAPAAFAPRTGTTLPSVAAATTPEPRPPLVVDTNELPFLRSSSLQGVSAKLLHWDEAQGLFTAIVQLEPGAELPARRCTTTEEILVLDGALQVNDLEIATGTYVRADPHVEPATLRAPEGALLLLVGSERGEILG
jgi:hypothetical protein